MDKKHEKNSTTTRKVKVVGKEQFINKETGEVENFQVIKIEDRDFDFTKIWVAQIIASLDLIGNKKMKVVFWIMEHLDRENKLCYTQRQISKESKCSLDTVHTTLKALLDANFMRKKNIGVYIVNPDLMFKGTRTSRMNVLVQYQKLDVDVQAREQAQKEYVKLENKISNSSSHASAATQNANEQTDIYDFIDK